MAEQILFDTAQRIIETVGSMAAEEIGLLWGFENELQSLNNTVSTIEAVLLDAEEQHAAGNHQVTVWLRKLEDVIYDADDLLDVVSTEALRRQVMTHHKKAKQVRIFFSKSNQLVYRLKMAHKIKAMRERLDAIDADRQRFHLKLKLSHVETGAGGNRDRDNTHSYVCAEAVIGRENDKKAVIHRLLDSNVEDNVSILPIVAIGGLGKTALAQLIINDEQIQKHFQLKMWVCVSDSFQVKNIVEKIFEAATKKKPKTMEMDTLIGKLKEIIDGKKYLLVLDDVWNEDHEKWSRLKQVLMGGASGSRILVTTRSEIVARIVRTVESYPLRGLDKDDSWSLFKQMAFERGQEPEQNSSIVAIGREILAKCSGVPLAIRTIGGLLRIKNSEAEWLAFKKNELSKISQNENDILPTLKLSYDHLPSHLKHCFAYCSLYPKDYQFNKSRLIQLWIAQGFVNSSDKNQCLEYVGNEYFMDLLWRSFFQEAKIDEFGNIMECKMHDLMHDLAILVAGSIITTLDDDKERNVAEKTRHVSIVGYDINTSSITTSLSKASSMRTFLYHSTSYKFWGESDIEAIFSTSKFLRVLHLRIITFDFLPSSIGKLKHLRYLDFSLNRNLKKLPNSITMLQNLQSLILSFCTKLEELPRDIKKLVNLRHLDIEGCIELAYMPRGLGQLTNLQTLSKFVVYKDPLFRHSSGLKELKGLNDLRGHLDIENLRHGKFATSECKAANLKEKQHLHALDLRWSFKLGGVIALDDIFDDEVLLEVLQPHPNLKILRLQHNYGTRLPIWLSSLTNLVRFELEGCRKCQYLPPLNQLPSLKVVHLIEMDALEYISSGSGDSNEFSSFFPSLKEIRLDHCPNLKGWWRRRDSSVEVNGDSHNFVEITEHPLLPSFPRLSKLGILHCPLLTSMPMFPHLEELDLFDASSKPLQQTTMMNMAAPQSPTSTATTSSSSTPLSKLKYIELDFIEDLETLPEDWSKNLTSLESLRIQSCKRLNSLSPGIQHLTSVQDLELYNCHELELANDEDGMQWQGLKSLLSLKFSHLPKLVSLPLGLQHATTLQSLYISNCKNLTAIPDWIHNFTSLQELRINECASLTSLPKGIRSLTSLRWLKIEKCPAKMRVRRR
ncbi:putative disease resistance protein RGA4 [Corylus avellana]|uniref:putative disease resistance protein RGA4 n=1 Tax=Corylus avellana TaxID=13451 RepID=UPI00286B496D|nr:putative disease resistance protein RGA4 [Corylus avellana]XP_059428642.1 putative disease resistance protein RGA4 [Corylus avellana]XP_059428649.1 putative disease resistance protein RGA4 [Corylus avellana]XP_059428655.1 putative disease resistance protein RGA4 [Corylus avellana]XP_059428660.1 putative disease resistance protein RGA4 [Corylus avellana]